MQNLRIGLLGFGTVANGVVRILRDNAQEIEGRLGGRIEITKIAVKQKSKPRALEVPEGVITDRAEEVVQHPDIQVVVELIGGVDEARALVLSALNNKKHVVTANKALLAMHGEEIFAAASKNGVDVFFEAAVGGGIPIIRTLRESFASERIQSIAGILNGTTNFILTAMAEGTAGYDETLREAQHRGFAEADPTADVEGHDAAQKLAILSSLGFSTLLRSEDVAVEGITTIEPEDLRTARAHGYAIKLLGVAERQEDAVSAWVRPAWVPLSSMIANVGGVLNAVLLRSDALGTSMLIGQGAGELPTGSAVVADIIDLCRSILLGSTGRIPHWATREESLRPTKVFDASLLSTPFYLCFTVLDTPGVLARIAGALGEQSVSLRVVEQHVHGSAADRAVPVVVITHEASESAVRAAIAKVDGFETTVQRTRAMRILDKLEG